MSGIKAAKALQMRLREFLGYLQEHRWIYKRAGGQSHLGYQDRVQSGDLEHKVTTITRGDGTEKVVEQVRVTPKGWRSSPRPCPFAQRGAA